MCFLDFIDFMVAIINGDKSHRNLGNAVVRK